MPISQARKEERVRRKRTMITDESKEMDSDAGVERRGIIWHGQQTQQCGGIIG